MSHTISEKNQKRFVRAVNQLQKVMEDCRKDDSAAQVFYYTGSIMMLYTETCEEYSEPIAIASATLIGDSGDPT